MAVTIRITIIVTIFGSNNNINNHSNNDKNYCHEYCNNHNNDNDDNDDNTTHSNDTIWPCPHLRKVPSYSTDIAMATLEEELSGKFGRLVRKEDVRLGGDRPTIPGGSAVFSMGNVGKIWETPAVLDGTWCFLKEIGRKISDFVFMGKNYVNTSTFW